MPRVALLTTGGTIASVRKAGEAAEPSENAAALLARVSLPVTIEVKAEAFCNLLGSSLDLETAFALCRRIAERLAEPEIAGAVITHGTDTMEETAFLADLALASYKPVVFTGAQRLADEADNDGPRNLADALVLAASPLARGLGAVIMFDQEFHAARDATKRHTSRTDAFVSAEHGLLGLIDRGQVFLHRRPLLRTHIKAPRIEKRVDLIYLYLGADGRFLRHAMADGARGIVLEAFGRGNCGPAVVGAAHEAISAGIPVLVTSRCPEGRVEPVYGGGGGSADLAAAGAWFMGDLSGPKARIALALGLGAGLSGEALRTTLSALAG